MSGIEIHTVKAPRDARLDGEHTAAVMAGLARWLHLAAAPTFATMALLTCVSGENMMCSAAHGMSLGGMVPMYALMSAFHLAPWLKLISRR